MAEVIDEPSIDEQTPETDQEESVIPEDESKETLSVLLERIDNLREVLAKRSIGQTDTLFLSYRPIFVSEQAGAFMRAFAINDFSYSN